MGSKMAAASRVVQVVKPHAPLMKFPDRKGSPRPDVQEALKAMVFPFTPPTPAAQQSSGTRPPGVQSASTVVKVQGIPDTLDTVKALPPKYRRKSLTTEEMEYIQRGGPE
ncbi:alpha-ketoglutarate dehydrogenase component 4 [Ambystoma mexicanum]|uniref:alpha-ketoglutarate dehydrogenase component 4 n=1 Tax=Ambystoma mexicanum TaxID=8296 RepID=UPI0037E7AC7A